MTTKMTGAEWKRFYADPEAWPDGAWHDDEHITVNGQDAAETPGIDYTAIPDDAAMTIHGGAYFPDSKSDDTDSLEGHFKKWRKRQTTVSFVVECPKGKEAAVRAAIKAAGGKA